MTTSSSDVGTCDYVKGTTNGESDRNTKMLEQTNQKCNLKKLDMCKIRTAPQQSYLWEIWMREAKHNLDHQSNHEPIASAEMKVSIERSEKQSLNNDAGVDSSLFRQERFREKR